VNGLVALGPDQNDHPSPKPSRADPTDFSVILAVVLFGEERGSKNLGGRSEIESSFSEGAITLGRIERDTHPILLLQ